MFEIKLEQDKGVCLYISTKIMAPIFEKKNYIYNKYI